MNHALLIEDAAKYLHSAGIRVLDKDWKHPEGELPIVANDSRAKTTLVVVVVLGHAARHPFLSRARVSRMRRLAVAWMNAHGVRFDQVRVDVVMVTYQVGGNIIEHVRAVGAEV